MKCCKCGKEVDTSEHKIPPQWFGQYTGQEMLKVICRPCIKAFGPGDWAKEGPVAE